MIMRGRFVAEIVKAGPPLALCFQLGACALPDRDPAPPPPSPPVAAAPVDKPTPPPPKAERRSPPAAARQSKAPPASPDELVGLDEGGVRKLLGAPAETRTDGAARILSYRSVGCTLEVIFFMDLKAGDLRVLDYQWDSSGNRTQAAKGCYPELRVPQ